MHFDDQRFGWRFERDGSVLVYEYGGERILLLRGKLRDAFVRAVEGPNFVSSSPAMQTLLNVGILEKEAEQ